MNLNPIWREAEGGLERIAVDGGWIYRDPDRGGICFVPAPALVATGARSRPRAMEREEDQAA